MVARDWDDHVKYHSLGRSYKGRPLLRLKQLRSPLAGVTPSSKFLQHGSPKFQLIRLVSFEKSKKKLVVFEKNAFKLVIYVREP